MNSVTFKALKFQSAMNRRSGSFSESSIGYEGDDCEDRLSLHHELSNLGDEAETAKNLEGITSKETQLKTLSVVDDPKARW